MYSFGCQRGLSLCTLPIKHINIDIEWFTVKIVIVDDNRDFIDLLGNVLIEAGYDVKSFYSSRKAIDYIEDKSNHFDMIVTDILMPEHDGFDVVDAARKVSDAKIIAMSGGGTFVSAEKSIEALEQTVDAWLVKPVRMSELLLIVEKLLSN